MPPRKKAKPPTKVETKHRLIITLPCTDLNESALDDFEPTYIDEPFEVRFNPDNGRVDIHAPCGEQVACFKHTDLEDLVAILSEYKETQDGPKA